MAQYGVPRGLPGEYPKDYDDENAPFTPAWSEKYTGLGRETLIRFAREFRWRLVTRLLGLGLERKIAFLFKVSLEFGCLLPGEQKAVIRNFNRTLTPHMVRNLTSLPLLFVDLILDQFAWG